MKSSITVATINDIPRLELLVNSAYRGEEAKKGWTHEADLIEGTLRTDRNHLIEMIEDPAAVILKYQEDDELLGCVYLQLQGATLYLGMLSVSPDHQAKGIGKQLMKAAEDYAREHNCSRIEMNVISARQELIDWYKRNGYQLTEVKRPFHNDGRFGIPKRPVEFIVMEKFI